MISSWLRKLIRILGILIVICTIMVFGALNTVYAAVADGVRKIETMRASSPLSFF